MAKTKKRKTGRPIKYTSEIIEEIGRRMLEWFKDPTNIWLRDFAISLGMSWQRFSEFAKVNDGFSEALKMAHDMQTSKLFRLGLSKNVNAAMPIFALKNTAGWRDVQELTGAGGQPLIPTVKDPYDELAKICLKLGVTFPGGNDGDGSKRGSRARKDGSLESTAD